MDEANKEEAGTQALLSEARQRLRQVFDPELGINVVDLGLVDGLSLDGGVLLLRYRLTSHACPVGPMIVDGMRAALEGLPGVSQVQVEQLMDAWSTDTMTPEGRLLLGG